jgi:hypothetical protein
LGLPERNAALGSADYQRGNQGYNPSRCADSTPRWKPIAPEELYARVLQKESEIRRIEANFHQPKSPGRTCNFREFEDFEIISVVNAHTLQETQRSESARDHYVTT